MEEIINKRKIILYKTLENRYIHKKNIENKEVIKKETIEEEKIEKKNIIGPFQLVVIKLPWYKKLFRSFLGFLGYYYE